MPSSWIHKLGYLGFIGLLGIVTGKPHLYGFYGFFGFFALRPPAGKVERLTQRWKDLL